MADLLGILRDLPPSSLALLHHPFVPLIGLIVLLLLGSHPLGGAPGLPQWDASMGNALCLLLAGLADVGILDLGGPSPSRHETLRRTAFPPEAREIFAAADLLHPEMSGILLQRRGPVGLVLRRSDACDL